MARQGFFLSNVELLFFYRGVEKVAGKRPRDRTRWTKMLLPRKTNRKANQK